MGGWEKKRYPPLAGGKSYLTRVSFIGGGPREFFVGGGGGGGFNKFRDSGGSCKLVQEISFHIVKKKIFFLIFGTLRLFMMTTKLFVIANVKQLRTGGSFRILLLFFSKHLRVLASKIQQFF